MNENLQLPNGLIGPLQILPCWFQNVIYFIVFLPLLIALLYYIQKRVLKKLPQSKIDTTHSIPKKQTIKRDGIKNEILVIKKIYSETKEYREGLYALFALVKTRLEKLTGKEIEEMTLTEIEHILSEKHILQFLKKITSLQYQKNEPDENDFNDAISESLKYVAYRKEIKLKKIQR
ncbi:MAG: hypothetical protein H7A23_15745 [Leptospiraceae bacterium]|nr:hypothetical protein [Leptospiraceae bacterium]MCP5496002.1 hypothetical protein [Leptospiraceae bacterium]